MLRLASIGVAWDAAFIYEQAMEAIFLKSKEGILNNSNFDISLNRTLLM